MLCIKCGGTGRYLGNGMMMADCNVCDGDDSEPKAVKGKDVLPPIDRKSKSYQKAIKDIMAVNPSISRPEAIKMFDEAYNKP